MPTGYILRKKIARQILLHIIFWAIIVTYFAWGFGFGVNYKAAFFNAILYLPGFIFIVYVHIYYLIPRYLITRKYIQFFTGLIRDAVPIDKRLDACSIALLLLEREQEVLKGLTGVERERQFARIIKLCASAQSGSDSQATTRLHRRFARDGREFPSAKKNRVA